MTPTDRTLLQTAFGVLQKIASGNRRLDGRLSVPAIDEYPLFRAIAALQSRLSEPEAADEVMDMALCESETCVLRIGQLYRFRPVGDCETCAKLKAAHDEAYAPFGLDTASTDAVERTGWPPGLLQDDSRELSRWLGSKPDAMQRAREAAADATPPAPPSPLSPTPTDRARGVSEASRPDEQNTGAAAPQSGPSEARDTLWFTIHQQDGYWWATSEKIDGLCVGAASLSAVLDDILPSWCWLHELAPPTQNIPAPPAVAASQATEQPTIHCPEKRKPGGCQLHNLHCGWPECNKQPADRAQRDEWTVENLLEIALRAWQDHTDEHRTPTVKGALREVCEAISAALQRKGD